MINTVNNQRIEIRKVNCDDDFTPIAKLIYETDPFIFQDWLGSWDNAKKIIPHMVNDLNNIYSYTCIYGVYFSSNIIGIAIIPSNFTYPTEMVETLIKQNHIITPKTYDNVIHQYFNHLTNYMDSDEHYVSNICIDKNYRGQGIGYLLLDFLKQHFESLVLDVLEENEGAVHLYKKVGFTVKERTIGYGPSNTYVLSMSYSKQ